MITIHGKSLKEIMAVMAWQLKIVVYVGSAFLLFSVPYVTYRMIFGVANVSSLDPVKKPGAIEVGGMKALAYFDPSIAVGQTIDDTAMIFTITQKGLVTEKTPDPETTQFVMLAKGFNNCGGWSYSKTLFESRAEDLLAPDGEAVLAKGTARYETPAIVYDPDDKGREWKVFAYRYFWSGQVPLAQRYSAIVMRTATDPSKEWSREEWILSAAPDYPPPPYQGLVRQHINTLHPDLAGYTSYSRPSVMAAQGVLVMSLSAFRGGATPEAVILLASVDHGESWRYLGTLLTVQMLPKMGPYKTITGATLMRHADKAYLATVLGDEKQEALGTFIIPFKSVSEAKLQSNADGAPVITKKIPLQSVAPTRLGGGYATYDEKCRQGILTAEHSGIRGSWQIFRTAQTPVSE